MSDDEKALAEYNERRQKLWADPFYSDFPGLYKEINDPHSSMSWGCTIGDGWNPLIYNLCVQLSELDAGVVFAQIKEKFGGLRIYYGFENTSKGQKPTDSQRKQADALIEDTIEKAAGTCESCGAQGSLRETASGWLFTSCDPCERKSKEPDND